MEWIVFVGFLIISMGFIAVIGWWTLSKIDILWIGCVFGIILWLMIHLISQLTGITYTQQTTEQVYPMEIIHNQIVTWVDDENIAQARPIDEFDIEIGDEEYVKVVIMKEVSKFFVDDETVKYVLVIRR